MSDRSFLLCLCLVVLMSLVGFASGYNEGKLAEKAILQRQAAPSTPLFDRDVVYDRDLYYYAGFQDGFEKRVPSPTRDHDRSGMSRANVIRAEAELATFLSELRITTKPGAK